jgi:hypothetical protein
MLARSPADFPIGTEHLAGDDQLLHFGGAFVDAQRADLAIEPLDRSRRSGTPRPPNICTPVDDRCAFSVAVILAMAASRVSSQLLHVARQAAR